MGGRAARIILLGLALLGAIVATAAAGPLRGRTYEGHVAPQGTNSERHRTRDYASGQIVLRVASNGRSLTVRFTSSTPVIYCRPEQSLAVQTTHAASISSSGSFKAAVAERFKAGPGPPSIVQIVTGRFYGGMVYGLVSTHAADCGGVTSFSARAR
jgi:hypothetical protein